MKLLQIQYLDICEAINEFGIDRERLSLVKKRGRIKIQIEGISPSFELFKRKNVSLANPDHQWEKSEYYELTATDTQSIVSTWEEVISAFKIWIKIQVQN